MQAKGKTVDSAACITLGFIGLEKAFDSMNRSKLL
jgi:hypothetical protein